MRKISPTYEISYANIPLSVFAIENINILLTSIFYMFFTPYKKKAGLIIKILLIETKSFPIFLLVFMGMFLISLIYRKISLINKVLNI